VIGYFGEQSHGPDMAVRCSESTVLAFQYNLGAAEVRLGMLQAEIDKAAAILGKVPEGTCVE
jgi:hypothetical protein